VKRILAGCVLAAAAFLCAVSGSYLHGVLLDYGHTQNDIKRQLNEMNGLRLEQNRPATQAAGKRSVSEAVNDLSTQVTGFHLLEKSVQTEKSDSGLDGWDEWRIEAAYTGAIDDLDAFVSSLEASGVYHSENLSLERNDAGLYELNLTLCFYTRHV